MSPATIPAEVTPKRSKEDMSKFVKTTQPDPLRARSRIGQPESEQHDDTRLESVSAEWLPSKRTSPVQPKAEKEKLVLEANIPPQEQLASSYANQIRPLYRPIQSPNQVEAVGQLFNVLHGIPPGMPVFAKRYPGYQHVPQDGPLGYGCYTDSDEGPHTMNYIPMLATDRGMARWQEPHRPGSVDTRAWLSRLLALSRIEGPIEAWHWRSDPFVYQALRECIDMNLGYTNLRDLKFICEKALLPMKEILKETQGMTPDVYKHAVDKKIEKAEESTGNFKGEKTQPPDK